MLSLGRSTASRAREKNLGPANAADSLKNRGRKGTRKLDRVGVKGDEWEHLEPSRLGVWTLGRLGAQVHHQTKWRQGAPVATLGALLLFQAARVRCVLARNVRP